MSLYVELNGHPAKTARLTIPTAGIWSADIVLDRDTNDVTDAPGSAVLKFVDLTLVGTVYRSGSLVGTASFRLVGGYGGWSKQLPAQGYHNAAGVELSTILDDAARLTGEKLNLASDRELGTHFARFTGTATEPRPASYLLDWLVPGWFIRPDGVTTTETRSSAAITSPFDVLPEGSSIFLGRIHVATEHPADWMPGRTFEAPVLSKRTIGGVEHRLDAGKLRTEAWTQE